MNKMIDKLWDFYYRHENSLWNAGMAIIGIAVVVGFVLGVTAAATIPDCNHMRDALAPLQVRGGMFRDCQVYAPTATHGMLWINAHDYKMVTDIMGIPNG